MNFCLCRQLNELACYRAGGLISATDMFKIFVPLDLSDVTSNAMTILAWMKNIQLGVRIEVHPVSVYLLTRIYFLCATVFHFTHAETTKLIKQRKVSLFFFVFVLFC